MPREFISSDFDALDTYECVEPRLGDELWRMDDRSTTQELRASLQLHLEICEDCRLRQAVSRRLADAARAGRVRIPGPERETIPSRISRKASSRWTTAAGWSGAMALAAGLVFALVMPPTPRDADHVLRAPDDQAFRRPVEGEVLLDRTPRLSWHPIDGATAYRIRIDEVAGDYEWSARTAEPRLDVPPSAPLPRGSDFRVFLEPVPADLAVPGGLSVSFRTGGTGAFLRHRLVAAPVAARVLAVCGLTLLAVSAAFSRRRLRHAS